MSPWTNDTTTMTIPCVPPRKSSTMPFRSPVAVAAPFLRVIPRASMIHMTCRPAMNWPAPKGTPMMWLTMLPRYPMYVDRTPPSADSNAMVMEK